MSPHGESRKLVPVYMDELDGDDFTDHMVRVFDKLGYDDVKRTKKGKDGGKDIIMYRGRDLYYVECKHWRDKDVGRPDVQKLDSAAHRAGAKHAFLVATGYFSPHAIEYADQMRGMVVELIDRDKLIGLNEEAGYRLVFGRAQDMGGEGVIHYYRGPPKREVLPYLQAWLERTIERHGRTEFVPPGKISSYYVPVYRLDIKWSPDPYVRKEHARPTQIITALLDARWAVEDKPDDPQAHIHVAPSGGGFDAPINELQIWDPQDAEAHGIAFQEFRVDEGAARMAAERFTKHYARRMGSNEADMAVLHIDKLMVPVYCLFTETLSRKRWTEGAFVNDLLPMRLWKSENPLP